MKIIFLDIDGVLCKYLYHEKEMPENKMYSKFMDTLVRLFEKDCVENLNKLIKETGAKIVISSTWRISYRDILPQYFSNQGIEGEIIGYTPRLPGKIRGNEIKEFIKNHPELQIDSFVILDDDSDMGDFKDRLVQTLFLNSRGELEDGLKEIHVKKAIKKLF